MKQLKYIKKSLTRNNLSLDRYLHEIGSDQLLTSEEEIELAKRIKQGDEEAVNRLVKANLKFVVSVAKQYQNKGLPLNDLINEGNLGLIKSAQRFDETKNCKFISYAVWWIRQSILQAIAEQSRVVRLPLNRVGTLNKYSYTVNKLEQKYKRTPTIDEVADDLNISTSDVSDIIQTSKRSVYIDTPLVKDETYNMQDILVDDTFPLTDDNINKESLRLDFDYTFLMLSQRESNVLRKYFGFGSKQMTLDEIGNDLGLTRERVRQIKEKAIKKIRKLKICDKLKMYLNKDIGNIDNSLDNYDELVWKINNANDATNKLKLGLIGKKTRVKVKHD